MIQEFKTSDQITDELAALGYKVSRGINKTGLVGILKNGAAPTLMISADMGEDAFVDRYQTYMGAVDFSDLVNIDPPIPSVYFDVGGTPPEQIEAGTCASHYLPLFKIDHVTSIKSGVEAMTLAALDLLSRK